MQLLFDFLPLIAFFVAYQVADIYVATATIMIAMPIQIAYQWFRHRTVNRMLLLSGVLVLLFGAATLLVRDEIFIQWKPTIAYALMAAGFLGTQLLGTATPMQRVMAETITLKPRIWKQINLMWVGVFIFLGAANLFVVYSYSQDVWVNFKVFGALGITLLAVIAQVIWVSRYAVEPGHSEPEGIGNTDH